jgi:transcriptional regulator with XRE-family HTH domain
VSLGTRIRKARESRNLSQDELARRVGCDDSLIRHYEADRREPSLKKFRKLCRLLNVSADYMLDHKVAA